MQQGHRLSQCLGIFVLKQVSHCIEAITIKISAILIDYFREIINLIGTKDDSKNGTRTKRNGIIVRVSDESQQSDCRECWRKTRLTNKEQG